QGHGADAAAISPELVLGHFLPSLEPQEIALLRGVPIAAVAAVVEPRRILEGLEVPGRVAPGQHAALDQIATALAEQDLTRQPVEIPAARHQPAELRQLGPMRRVAGQIVELMGIALDIEEQLGLPVAMDVFVAALAQHQRRLRQPLEEELAHCDIPPALATAGEEGDEAAPVEGLDRVERAALAGEIQD